MRSVYLDLSKFDNQRRKLKLFLEGKISAQRAAAARHAQTVAIHMAMKLGEITFPSSNAIGIAASAVRFDVGRVYITPGKAFEILRDSAGARVAGAFYAAFKHGDIGSAERVLRSNSSPIKDIEIGRALDPKLHEKSRDANGRVMLANPVQIVTASELQEFTVATIARLGKTASGWFACVEKLGGDGNAIRWKGTAVHGSDGGTITYFGERLVMTNTRPLAKKLTSPGQVARIREEGKKMLSELIAGDLKSSKVG